MIEVSAPARAGIIGNPSDMYGGTVISCAVGLRAWCRVEQADALSLEVSESRLLIERYEDLAARGEPVDIARAAVRYWLRRREVATSLTSLKFALTAGSEIPVQAGLAGSTALLTAILGVIHAWSNVPYPPWHLAETVGHVEFHEMDVVCGYQDQYMAAYGGLNAMNFRDKEKLLHMPGQEPLASVERLGEAAHDLPLTVATTGVQHHSGRVHTNLRERWVAGERQVVKGIRTIAGLAKEGKRAVLNGDWQALGDMMNQNHAIIRDLGGSGEANERLIEAAIAGGAWGAKLAGAGGGGTVIAVSSDPDRIGQAMLDAGAERLIPLAPNAPGLIVERSDVS